MATVANYGELKTAIADLAHRADLTSEIPAFVERAEATIARKVRSAELLTSAQLTESDRSSGAVYTLPSNFLGARSIYGTTSGVAYQVDIVSLAELRRYPSSVRAVFAAIYGYSIEFRGTPDTDAAFDMIHYARPTAFALDADFNVLLTNHSDLYIHAAMRWLYIHTQDLELAQAHSDAFVELADDLNDLAEKQFSSPRGRNAFNLGNSSARSAM